MRRSFILLQVDVIKGSWGKRSSGDHVNGKRGGTDPE